jgi:hypothetical protein
MARQAQRRSNHAAGAQAIGACHDILAYRQLSKQTHVLKRARDPERVDVLGRQPRNVAAAQQDAARRSTVGLMRFRFSCRLRRSRSA